MRYSSKTRLKFGKYKDCLVEDVIIRDPMYIEWCISNTPNFKLSSDLNLLLREVLEEQYPDDPQYD